MAATEKRAIVLTINYDHSANMYPARPACVVFPNGLPSHKKASDTVAREVVDMIRADCEVCSMLPKSNWGSGAIGMPIFTIYAKKIEHRSAIINFIEQHLDGRVIVAP